MSNEYHKMILKARKNQVTVTNQMIEKITGALEKAYTDIERLIADLDGDPRKTVKRQLWKYKKDQLAVITDELHNGFSQSLKEGMTLSALQASTASQVAERMMLAGTDLTVSKDFALIPLKAVDAVWKRMDSKGLTLSDRVWNLKKHTKRRVDAIVLSGIARGQSAVDMAKELQFDILGIKHPKQIPESLRWTERISKAVRARGTIHYNALRLARTEIGNAYHEADIMAAKASKIVMGVKWNLSPSHGKYDVCLRKGTLIRTIDGDVPIEKVRIGDLVYTHKGRLQKVVKLYRRKYTGKHLINLCFHGENNQHHELVLTPNHPVLTDSGWTRANDLQKGCYGYYLFDVSVSELPLKYKKFIEKSNENYEIVYNLAVEKDNSYFANGIAVHNCDLLATQDVYGLGPGVYPPGAAPLYPHPNDLCFVTRVLKPRILWGKEMPKLEPKKEYNFAHPETTSYLDATRKKQITVNITDKYKKTVEEQFFRMQENIVGAKRFKTVPVRKPKSVTVRTVAPAIKPMKTAAQVRNEIGIAYTKHLYKIEKIEAQRIRKQKILDDWLNYGTVEGPEDVLKIDKLNQEIERLRKKIERARKQMTVVLRKKLQVSTRGYKIKAHITCDPDYKSYYESGLREFSKLVDRSILPDIPVKIKELDRFRGYFDPSTNTAHIFPLAGERQTIHEIAHWLEHNNPHVLDKLLKFYEKRTKGEALEPLGEGYGERELTRKDKFIIPYMGKDYEGTATEILSIGLELFYRAPHLLALRDPEYFDFIYNLVRGIE